MLDLLTYTLPPESKEANKEVHIMQYWLANRKLATASLSWASQRSLAHRDLLSGRAQHT